MLKTIYLIVPCYNESEVIKITASRLLEKISLLIFNNHISSDSRIIFVDDGSSDDTWSLIDALVMENKLINGLKLSRNRGHQNALLAGLMEVRDKCDAAISLDADLQDDIDVIDQFIYKFINQNCEIVYGVRSERKTDTYFKRNSAQFFYYLMSKLGVDIIYNHADYRLMSSRAITSLAEFKEVNLFLRGIIPLIGYKTDIVYYERNERLAGESKYPLKKMISFALEGITSLSIKPIRMVTILGFIVFISSLLPLVYSLIQWVYGNTIQGWTTLIVSIWALGGIQILCLGIVGEYIGKIYLESKSRPKYIVESYIE